MNRVFRVVVFLIGYALFCGGDLRPANAAATPEPEYCGAVVKHAIPLDAADGAAATWAFGLAVGRRNGSGRASGALHVEAGTEAYDLAFADALVASTFDATKATPLVYRFPQPLRVDLAYVSRLAEPSPGPCVPFGAWTRKQPHAAFGEVSNPFPTQTGTDFLTTARAVAVTNVDADLRRATPACAQANVAARTIRAIAPIFPRTVERRDYTTNVLVDVLPNGEIVETAIYESSGSDVIDSSALEAARRSQFQAARIKCMTIGGPYIFRVEFSARWPAADHTSCP